MKFTDNIWKSLGILALLIVLCSFFARTVFSSDTLANYAERNPEIAYSKSEPETEEKETSEETETQLTGFFYEPIPQYIREKITGISYPEDAVISLDELSYVSVLYNDFSGDTQIGELICNNSIAQDLVEIFEELYRCGYQFEQIALIDEYGGDDTLSMEHNNTSCFNYRVVDGSTKLSKHAYGLAIDINPYYNPYVVFNKDGLGETYISPQGSEPYADRTAEFPYKIDENDLCYKLFIEHGFTWGGNWNSCKDYQHFQK
ncbi:MAG: M15 family metallopeptidase [Lachnospiraceae bacterium]